MTYIKEKIIVPIFIEGVKYKFLFDTGAPNIVSTEISKPIQSKKEGEISIKDVTNKKDSLDVAQVTSLIETFAKLAGLIIESIFGFFLLVCRIICFVVFQETA